MSLSGPAADLARSLGYTAAPSSSLVPTSSRVLKEWSPRGIKGRIDLLRERIGKSLRTPAVVRELPLQITRHCPWRDDLCELSAIWYWMHRNIRYVADVHMFDTFQGAATTAQYGGGDCDDGMTLIATLVMGVGFGVKGRITKNIPDGPWAHIYPLVGVPKLNPRSFVPLDWTLGFERFLAHPPQAGFLEFDGHQTVFGKEIEPAMYMGWQAPVRSR